MALLPGTPSLQQKHSVVDFKRHCPYPFRRELKSKSVFERGQHLHSNHTEVVGEGLPEECCMEERTKALVQNGREQPGRKLLPVASACVCIRTLARCIVSTKCFIICHLELHHTSVRAKSLRSVSLFYCCRNNVLQTLV